MFNQLHESNQKSELFGSVCRWHLRKDGQITIYEIIVEDSKQRQGIGKKFVERLKRVNGAKSIFANCPADLLSNGFYQHMGFELESQNPTRNGTPMNQWRLWL